jgi:hypothetical protein
MLELAVTRLDFTNELQARQHRFSDEASVKLKIV